LRDTWNSYKERYEVLKTAEGTVEGRSKKFGEVKAVQGKKGPILLIEDPSGDKEKTQFLGWPEGKTYETITQEDVDEFMEVKKDSLAQASIGTLDGKPIVKKSGPFGQYVQWGDVRLSVKGTESVQELEKALKEKGATTLHVLGPFEFRKGQYGLYMFKKDIKERKFVGLPEGCDPKKLTVEEAVKLYQTGLQNKAKASAYASSPTYQQGGGTRGGGRGGFRGRGRGRGGHA
jgi:topoisomerase IA-like protein